MKSEKSIYTFDEILDKHVGEANTPERVEYDIKVELAMVGQKIKELREAKHYTQKQLGELIGVQSAQICKIEKGQNLSMANVLRVFRALGYYPELNISTFSKSLSAN